MSATFELKTPEASVTVGRYTSRLDAPDKHGSHYRYNITNTYGAMASDLTRNDLAVLARWIVKELASPHKDE